MLEMAYDKIDRYDEDVTREIASHVGEILRLLGEDPSREGLVKTPERVAKALQFLTRGYAQDGEQIIKSAIFDEQYSQMVIVRDIELFSTCEHHMMPFIGKAHVAYIPNGKITGLSKIARVVETYARRLQVQERLTVQIRDCIQESLHPMGVAVVIEALHTCMSMRGVQKSNAITTTSAFSGLFMKSDKTRNEFLQLIGQKH
ncbi:MAG: GTP cyclohydrolase I FolE [Bacteroidales bacterium]|nr:GTP cyclohydrolase I FolE [Bacteroidales bacterium]